MKKGKGLKKKVIAGVVAISVFAGSSIAFASTDAGQKLREWYDGMFHQSVSGIEDETSSYLDSKLPGLEEEYNALKDEAHVNIDLSRELETGKSLEEIIKAKMSHLESLDSEKAEILANIGAQYYGVFLDGYFEIGRLHDEGLTNATNDLTAFTGDEGQEAIAQMTTNINTAKDQAVQELEDAIREAQEELAAEIDNHEEVTIRNLKQQVDWQIDDLRESVTALLGTLVTEQQNIIMAKAQELEDNAKAALDDVVNGIN